MICMAASGSQARFPGEVGQGRGLLLAHFGWGEDAVLRSRGYALQCKALSQHQEQHE